MIMNIEDVDVDVHHMSFGGKKKKKKKENFTGIQFIQSFPQSNLGCGKETITVLTLYRVTPSRLYLKAL